MPRSLTVFLELVIGILLLLLGWLTVFIMTICSHEYEIQLSILGYVLSLLGLVLATYGYASLVFRKRRASL